MGKQNSRRSQSAATVPVALTIAGSDTSAGAGIQADLKTFSALGVYGLTAVTCVVAEIPGKVSRVERVSVRMVRDQVEVLAKNFQIGAIKTGLLCSAEIVSAVAKAIRGIESLRGRRIPLVIDPVMIASSGDRLLKPAAIDVYEDQLFPLATLITPNLDEAALLIGIKIKDREQMEKATKALASKYRAAILLKGGHLRGDNAIDLLFHKNKLTEFSARFVRGIATHGTGCTYSAAIAAGLASGLPLEKAIRRAKKFVTKSIVRHFRWKGKSGKIVALKQSI
ncbi:MAG: bifunctional hydroxymethylpyrimidine kinase/phosphomethylpyrimidine kinase [Verrucomicrobia bacterium]|nr:MAG: bifunctional hydroxymethylpyrimidine kinase/phosphomethylpyrimidine kinase [Verrucomicrobiota bacterium]